MTAMSHEQALKQRYAAARARCLGTKTVRPIRQEPVQKPAHVPEEPNMHVVQSRARIKLSDRSISPAEYLKAWCVANGTSVAEIRSSKDPKGMYPLRRGAIISLSERFPDLSTNAIGRLVNRDHSSVRHALGRLQRGPSGSKVAKKLTVEQVIEIRRRFDAGEPFAPIAACFGIAQSTVSKIGHRKAWRRVPEAA